MSTFDKAIEIAYSSNARCLGEFAIERPKSTKSSRHRAIQRPREISTHFLPARQRLVRKIDTKAPARSLNIPLIALLTKQLFYSTKALPRDLVYGRGIVGGIETTNSLVPRNAPATANLERLKSSLRVRNGSIIKSLSKARVQS